MNTFPKRAKPDSECSYSMDWLQKGIWYGPTKLYDRLSQNVQDPIYQPLRSGKIWHKINFLSEV